MPPQPQITDRHEAERPGGAGSPVILLVEADDHLAQVIAAYLQRDGYWMVCTDGLDEAAAAAKHLRARQAPVLLILDLDHLTVEAESLDLAALASLPTLLLASDPVPPRAARRSDVVPLLPKPFDMHDLRRQVGLALHRSTAGQE